MNQPQTSFLNRLGIITTQQQRQIQFEDWMKNRIKNVHIADNLRMNRAIEAVE